MEWILTKRPQTNLYLNQLELCSQCGHNSKIGMLFNFVQYIIIFLKYFLVISCAKNFFVMFFSLRWSTFDTKSLIIYYIMYNIICNSKILKYKSMVNENRELLNRISWTNFDIFVCTKVNCKLNGQNFKFNHHASRKSEK